MGYASRNKVENHNLVDVTDSVNLYGVLCQLYQETKKTRPDLTPKENCVVIGLGKNSNLSLAHTHDRILQLANMMGLKLTQNCYKKAIEFLLKQKMVAFYFQNQGDRCWTAVELLKVKV